MSPTVAQVGSGFDVSAGIYGTHTYIRFSPSELADALSAGDAPPITSKLDELSADSTASLPPLERIAKCVCARGGWDAERGQLRLPSCFRLLMGDVCGGSSTPSMVRKVGLFPCCLGLLSADLFRVGYSFLSRTVYGSYVTI